MTTTRAHMRTTHRSALQKQPHIGRALAYIHAHAHTCIHAHTPTRYAGIHTDVRTESWADVQVGACRSEHTFAFSAESLFTEENYHFTPVLGPWHVD